jgi:hypothetical protein
MDSEPKSPDEIEVDRLLGNLALVKLSALQPLGGPSLPTLYRAQREGLIKIVKNGRNNAITRATAKRILLEGLREVSFVYGKQAVQQAGKRESLALCGLALRWPRRGSAADPDIA